MSKFKRGIVALILALGLILGASACGGGGGGGGGGGVVYVATNYDLGYDEGYYYGYEDACLGAWWQDSESVMVIEYTLADVEYNDGVEDGYSAGWRAARNDILVFGYC